MGKPDLNLHVDEALLAAAQAAGVSAEQVAERALRQRWAEENADAIEDYNRRIRERGVFSDGLRTW